MSRAADDLASDRFGRLVAIELVPAPEGTKGSVRAWWRCVCDCGGEVVVRASMLRRAQVRSCGCLLADQHRTKSERPLLTAREELAARRAAAPPMEARSPDDPRKRTAWPAAWLVGDDVTARTAWLRALLDRCGWRLADAARAAGCSSGSMHAATKRLLPAEYETRGKPREK